MNDTPMNDRGIGSQNVTGVNGHGLGGPTVRAMNRFASIVLSAGVLTAGLISASPAASAEACGGSGSVTTVNGTLQDTATYLIQCPAGAWNGTLFLYSHGYVRPGDPNPAKDTFDPRVGEWLLDHGFALAGSSYATTGWAVKEALPDQMGTLAAFDGTFGTPAHTIAWGESLGGKITTGLIQRHPGTFSAALPICGLVSGSVATMNTALDAAFAFRYLIASSAPLQLVNITNPLANLGVALTAATAAQQTPQGRARLALVAALADTPGWFDPFSAQPAPGDFAAQEASQFAWDMRLLFPFAFAFRSDIEVRAGGNPSWNTGVNYASDLARSANLREVIALYQAAGLSLSSDLAILRHAPRISADHTAVNYLTQNITYNGDLPVPVLTMHTTGDGFAVPENEQAYRHTVDRAGSQPLLRQIFVHRAGHCVFTAAEMITAMRVLLNRLDTGRWDMARLGPASLNSQATGLGAHYSYFLLGGTSYPAPPAFISYRPPQYLRPFDLTTHNGR